MTTQPDIHRLTEHLFRDESKKIVSALVKLFGTDHLELAEDVVQETLLDAMNTWKFRGVPENPGGWLFTSAKHKAIDIIRRKKHTIDFDFNDEDRPLLASEYTLEQTVSSYISNEHIHDDLLRMMFVCCHPELSAEQQIALILKTLCGFSTSEIAKTFHTGEDTISKRLYRAKEFFRTKKIRFQTPSQNDIHTRVGVVLNAIYLIFSEGYHSTNTSNVIRRELIEEAVALCSLLEQNPLTQLPEVYALMALMYFHSARVEGRLDSAGEIILLENQDRAKWNRGLIDRAADYLERSSTGNTLTAYHVEAAIAHAHCVAPSFEATDWKLILSLYNMLATLTPSWSIALSRCVALLYAEGAESALAEAEKVGKQYKLHSNYLHNSLLGDVHCKLEDSEKALEYYELAVSQTDLMVEKNLLSRKIEQLV